MVSLVGKGLLCCPECFYTWEPRYKKKPKLCPRCERPLEKSLDPELRADIVELLDEDLTLYQRQQLLRAITLWVSGNVEWSEQLLDWLRGEEELDYYELPDY